MTADPNGWPDASKPGVPENPERDGWHWLRYRITDETRPSEWSSGMGGWLFSLGCIAPEDAAILWAGYLGPCLTPAEVSARVAAAEEAGARAMLEACAGVAASESSEWARADLALPMDACGEVRNNILALPLPTDALAASERAAEARGRVAGLREAAAKVRVHATAAKQCSDEGDVIHRIRAEYLAKAFALNTAADDIEAAILALAEEAGDG